jgi:hypothetical protein
MFLLEREDQNIICTLRAGELVVEWEMLDRRWRAWPTTSRRRVVAVTSRDGLFRFLL